MMDHDPDQIQLPEAVKKAALAVCGREPFLDGLRDKWEELEFAALCDRELGQQSGVSIHRKLLEPGIEKLKAVKDWLAPWGGQSSPLYLAYWLTEEKAHPALDRFERRRMVLAQLDSDYLAIARMLERAELDFERLNNTPATKRERLFPATLATVLCDLIERFCSHTPSLSDFGKEAKLMAVIAEAVGASLTQEAARKALAKSLGKNSKLKS